MRGWDLRDTRLVLWPGAKIENGLGGSSAGVKQCNKLRNGVMPCSSVSLVAVITIRGMRRRKLCSGAPHYESSTPK